MRKIKLSISAETVGNCIKSGIIYAIIFAISYPLMKNYAYFISAVVTFL